MSFLNVKTDPFNRGGMFGYRKSSARSANYMLTVYSLTGKKVFFFAFKKSAKNAQRRMRKARNYKVSYLKKI